MSDRLINLIWEGINVLELNNNNSEIRSLIIRSKIAIHNGCYGQLHRCNVRIQSEVKLINDNVRDVKKHIK